MISFENRIIVYVDFYLHLLNSPIELRILDNSIQKRLTGFQIKIAPYISDTKEEEKTVTRHLIYDNGPIVSKGRGIQGGLSNRMASMELTLVF